MLHKTDKLFNSSDKKNITNLYRVLSDESDHSSPRRMRMSKHQEDEEPYHDIRSIIENKYDVYLEERTNILAWTEDEILEFMDIQAKHTYNEIKSKNGRYEFARLYILFHYGGICPNSKGEDLKVYEKHDEEIKFMIAEMSYDAQTKPRAKVNFVPTKRIINSKKGIYSNKRCIEGRRHITDRDAIIRFIMVSLLFLIILIFLILLIFGNGINMTIF